MRHASAYNRLLEGYGIQKENAQSRVKTGNMNGYTRMLSSIR